MYVYICVERDIHTWKTEYSFRLKLTDKHIIHASLQAIYIYRYIHTYNGNIDVHIYIELK